jgi:hypothetical protein
MNTVAEPQTIKLRTEFTKNVDRLGTHHFKQARRIGDVCIYQRTKPDGSLVGFEVFITKCKAFPDGKGGFRPLSETP